ncbi:hypothetical protein RchiOBHm_Chr1g0328151 [Rosa chinensis]|uniref:Uncharacterized protein n=1 Tax=Rosa chinensis TaxID=74649 RepID=A0A2P6SAN1_ROSCH|nr:hypothetical protein RchiOBHm_Chr1g0328151 [Rosa chinensis]
MDEAELDRATMWIKARQDKNGGFKDPLVEEKAKKIVSFYLVCEKALQMLI